MLSKEEESILLHDLLDRCKKIEHIDIDEDKGLEPLFKNEKEYDDFIERHNKNSVKSRDIKST